MESLRLDTLAILAYQQNRPPYLMIDIAEEVVPGSSARGYKNLTMNEWFFEHHFPGDPNMPGLLQVEALVQLSALMVLTLPGNQGKVVYLVAARNIKLSRKVLPGDRFDLQTTLTSWKRGLGQCSGTGSVNGEIACSAEFSIVMPAILQEYKVV